MSQSNMEIHGEHIAGGEYHLNCRYCRGEVKNMMRLSETNKSSVVLVASENPAVKNIRILEAIRNFLVAEEFNADSYQVLCDLVDVPAQVEPEDPSH